MINEICNYVEGRPGVHSRLIELKGKFLKREINRISNKQLSKRTFTEDNALELISKNLNMPRQFRRNVCRKIGMSWKMYLMGEEIINNPISDKELSEEAKKVN